MGKKKLSILVVHYQHYDLLKACLQSICASQLSDYEVIVIDNSANTLKAAEIRREFPLIILEERQDNLGYAAGNNRALEISCGDFVFLLNYDATVDSAMTSDMLKEFIANDNIAALQPLIFFQQDHKSVNNCGLDVQYLGYAWDHGFNKRREQIRDNFSPKAFSGAAVILRRSALDSVGLFDEEYFLYHEDVDLSLRLRNAGYTIQYNPSIYIYHQYSFKRDPWRYFYLERNRWFTIIKNYPLLFIILILPAAFFMEFGVLIYSLFGGWSKEKIKSWGAVIKAVPRLLKQRRTNRKETSIREFISGMKGGVVFAEVNSPLLRYIANPLLELYWLILRSSILFATSLIKIKKNFG